MLKQVNVLGVLITLDPNLFTVLVTKDQISILRLGHNVNDAHGAEPSSDPEVVAVANALEEKFGKSCARRGRKIDPNSDTQRVIKEFWNYLPGRSPTHYKTIVFEIASKLNLKEQKVLVILHGIKGIKKEYGIWSIVPTVTEQIHE